MFKHLCRASAKDACAKQELPHKTWAQRACLVLVLSAGLGSISGVNSAEPWNFQALMQELAKVKHTKLKFTETKKSIFLITNTTTKGSIEYHAPNFIEKNTLSPFRERVVIDGDNMMLQKYRGTGKAENTISTQNYSVQAHPLLQASVDSMRQMLSGDFAMIDQNYEVEMSGVRENWALSLTPKTPEVQEYIERIDLTGADAQISMVVTIQADGDESTLKLSAPATAVSSLLKRL